MVKEKRIKKRDIQKELQDRVRNGLGKVGERFAKKESGWRERVDQQAIEKDIEKRYPERVAGPRKEWAGKGL